MNAQQSRFVISTSAGSREGKRFAIWDRKERRIREWRATEKEARAVVKRMNADREDV